VLEAESGPEAVAMYQRYRPDAVFLDISMPGGGMTALVAIKEADPAARVGMLTGRSDEQTVTTALSAGARDYIVKPFTKKRLLAAVERVLG
jgi:DNA-binding response OmpR family regulator